MDPTVAHSPTTTRSLFSLRDLFFVNGMWVVVMEVTVVAFLFELSMMESDDLWNTDIDMQHEYNRDLATHIKIYMGIKLLKNAIMTQ